MILDTLESLERLNSPNNLMNRLRLNSIRSASPSVDLFVGPQTDSKQIEYLPPRAAKQPVNFNEFESEPSSSKAVNDVLDDLDEKITDNSIKTAAKSVLSGTLTQLQRVLPNVEKPSELSRIAGDMQRVLTAMEPKIDQDKVERKNVIIYRPVINTESNYKSVHINE